MQTVTLMLRAVKMMKWKKNEVNYRRKKGYTYLRE